MTDYRTIDLAGMTPVEPVSQPAPQLMWIAVADLVIDDRYQRPLNAGNIAAIRRIATDFRWARFSPVLVAPVPGGRYALIDGQHRAHAAALCGIESIPAMVVLVAPEEQALAFIQINTSQIRVGSHNLLRAALSAGEPWAIECRDRVAAAGCRLMTANWSQNSKKPGMIFCVDAIRRLVDAGHGAAVTTGLDALLRYKPDATANFHNALLVPYLAAVGECGGTADEWLAVLRHRNPWHIFEAADRWAETNGKPRAQTRKRFFMDAYRKGDWS